MNKYFDFVTSAKWLVLVTSLILLVATAIGARNLTFRSDYRTFFSKGNPELMAFDRLQDMYSKNDNVVFVLMPKSGDVFNQETLSALTQLTALSWQIPYSRRVDSLTNFQYSHAEQDELYVDDLVEDPANLTPEQLAKIRAIAQSEPLLLRRAVSADGSATAVNVTLSLPELSNLETPEVASAVRKIMAEMAAAYPDIDCYVTGVVMLNNAFLEVSLQDAETLIPAMFGIIILVMGILLRSTWATLGCVFVIVASIVVAMGLFGWGGWFITGPTSCAPTIIVTIAVADSVHLLNTFLLELRHGVSREQAMKDTLRINFRPIFITSVTTIIGFLSMNTSEVPLFRDLGNLVAMGVAAAWLFTIYTLPALMMVLPVKPASIEQGSSERMQGWANFVIRHHRVVFWSTLLVSGVVILFNMNNVINDEFIKNVDPKVEFRRHTDLIEQKLTGMYTLEYSVHAQDDNTVMDLLYLQDLERLVTWLRQQPDVVHVNSVVDTFKRLNRNMHDDDDAYYKLPENRELAAQYLLIYEMMLPFGFDLNNQINLDKSATRLLVTINNISSAATLALEQRVADWVKENGTHLGEFYGASPALMFSHIGYRNVTSMIKGTLIALVLITLVMVVALRSVGLGLTSMIPNVLPIAITFGIWGAINGNVGIALATSVGMALGIVVDDTVHFLSKYLRGRQEHNLSREDAIRYAFSTVGTAMWVTSAVLICGFLVLAQSTFLINASQGTFAAIAIATALLIDFLFVPALLLIRKD